MPLNGANVQQNVVGILAMLESSFIASFPDVIESIRREGYVLLVLETLVAALDPSISNELHHQLLDPFGQDDVPTS